MASMRIFDAHTSPRTETQRIQNMKMQEDLHKWIDSQFDHAVRLYRKVLQDTSTTKALVKLPSTAMLDIYAYYKQATCGNARDLNVPKPSIVWYKARARWNAWSALHGCNMYTAKGVYIQLVHQYISALLY